MNPIPYSYATIAQLGPWYLPVRVTTSGLVDFANTVALSSLQLAKVQAEAFGKKHGIEYQDMIITIQESFITICQIESRDKHWHPVRVGPERLDVLHVYRSITFSDSAEPAMHTAKAMAEVLKLSFYPQIGRVLSPLCDRECLCNEDPPSG